VVVQAEEVSRAVGFVAAGGRSVRMGRDKALLPWAGATLLDHALARLRSVCGDVRILCGPAPRYEDRGAEIVLDRRADAGPLAGLEAALGAAPGRPLLLLGVDLPFVTPALLERLSASLGTSDAAVPVVGGRPEPLCAAYGPGCLPAVRARLDAGERRMTSFWRDVSVREITEADLAGLGDPTALFRNLNTPSDLALE
jgi:molybdopterin-guanine dinucleotide biosynthesis protein A